jgi:hypothetical protein
MPDTLPGWGSKTFNNVISLLGKSPSWQNQFPGAATKQTAFSPVAGAAAGIDSSAIWKWASEGGQLGVTQPASQTGLTPFTPEGPASPITAQDLADLQNRNAAFALGSDVRTAALESGYRQQLMNEALQLRSQDLTNQELVAANDPNNIAKRGALYQEQMSAASNSEANMLDAVQRARYNSMVANATGIGMGMKAG